MLSEETVRGLLVQAQYRRRMLLHRNFLFYRTDPNSKDRRDCQAAIAETTAMINTLFHVLSESPALPVFAAPELDLEKEAHLAIYNPYQGGINTAEERFEEGISDAVVDTLVCAFGDQFFHLTQDAARNRFEQKTQTGPYAEGYDAAVAWLDAV